MKAIGTIIILMLQLSLFANNEEIPIKSNIHQVTVFEKGAQVSRTASTRIKAGNSIVKFVDIAPHILSSSIQVKGTGDFTILSVKYNQNYLNKSKLSDALLSNQSQQDSLVMLVEDKQTALIVLREEYSLITTNKDIGGDNGVNLNELKATSEFYRSRLKEIKLEELKINREIKDLNKIMNDLNAQKQNLSRSFKDYTSEIILAIESEGETKADFTLAIWFKMLDGLQIMM